MDQNQPGKQTEEDLEINQISMMQSLSIYFSAPSPRPLPNERILNSSPIAILKFLYPYFTSQFNKQKLQIPLAILMQRKSHTLSQIISSGGADRKMLLNRFLGLYSVVTNFNSGKELVPVQKVQQKQLVQLCISKISELQGQEQIYLINKVVVLNRHELLLSKADCLQLIVRQFTSLAKPHKIIQALIIQGMEATCRQIVRDTNSQKWICKLIPTLLNGLEFAQGHSSTLHEFLFTTPMLQSAILSCLLAWWAKGDDSLSTQTSSQFKTNLLAIVLSGMAKQQLIEKGITEYLSEGIQKRMGKDNYLKRSAIIIWVRMAKALGLQDTVEEYADQDLLFEAQPLPYQQGSDQEESIDPNLQSRATVYQKVDSDQDSQTNQLPAGNDQYDLVEIKPPRNIYDCILGLRNANRRKVTVKYLSSIMLKYPDDLTLSWLQLAQTLIAPLHDDHLESLVTLFTLKPIEVVDVFSDRFFKGDCTTHERIILMEAMKQAVEQLASNPKKYQREIEDQDRDFYFNKVKSRYFNEQAQHIHQEGHKAEKEGRTRRWGHTRIAHEKKLRPISSLLILSNDPYINRLYEIVNAVFFKMISKLPNSVHLLRNEDFTKSLLTLFCAFIDNIKNHLQKYSIISQISGICQTVLTSYKDKPTKNIMACIQVLLKISVAIDRFVPQTTLISLIKCMELLKERKEYGINPFIGSIQENVYSNMQINTGL